MPRTLTLLEWLLLRYPDTPRTRAKQWIQAGRVQVGGATLRKPHHVIPDPGESLQLLDRHRQSLGCGAGWQIHPRVELLFLDSSVAVVNKGPGLISVPAANGELSALSILADFLTGQLRSRTRNPVGGTVPSALRKLQPQPVHRLDQYTSGVFCMAMNPKARHHLIEQLSAHRVQREYVAFVDGCVSVPRGTWRDRLEFDEEEWREQVLGSTRTGSGPGQGLEAITHFEKLVQYRLAGDRGFVTKLRLRLETGRKHQIRAQAAHAGLPLIGDRTYHHKYRADSRVEPPIPFARQALHAQTLTFEHPEQPGKVMTWTARLPKDLQQLEATLRANSGPAQR